MIRDEVQEKHQAGSHEAWLEKEAAYWSQKLAGPPEAVGLPLDRPRPLASGFRQARVEIPVEEEVQRGLLQLCKGNDTLLLVAFVAVVKAWLHRSTGAEDIIVGTAIHRRYAELASLNKVLSLRDRVTDASTLKDLLLQVKETISEAYAHQKLPFDRLRKLLAAALPDPASPLFRVAVLMEQINDLASLGRLLPDLTWIVSRTNERIHCRIEYNAKLFQAASVQAFGETCIRIASALVADPGARIGELALLAPERERELLHDFNATGREYPRDCTIPELFEREAGRCGEKTALLCGSLELSYEELNGRANRLAHHLRRLGVGAGARVGILLDHSPEAVVAILAVLKAGGAYVPFDPSAPAERLAFMLADAEIAVLLTQDRLAQRCSAGEAVVLRLDADQQLFSQESSENPPAGAMPQDVAYIIYTSGSTGRPKGVLISHSSLVNYIWWSKYIYLRGEALAFSLYSSLAFDLTVTSLFTPLVTGNRLVIYRSEEGRTSVLDVLRDDRTEVLKLTPSHLALIQEHDNRGSRMRRLIVGGEALETRLARRVYESFGSKIEIFNEYGPTEATVGCMIHRFDPEAQDRAFVPIGRPAANTRIYLLGEDLKPVGMNAPGELYISGDGVAQGYWHRDDLTAERFLEDPFHEGGRMYKTGDLARWLPEGVIDFLGRRDGQIKFLGHRIELDEIRWALGQHRKVRDSVVSATEDENGNRVLLAYYVAREALDVAELRSFLSSYIAEETIPSFFVHMKRLPLTLNGKLNHQALPSLSEAKKQLRQEIVAPRNPTEQQVAEIFRQVLGLQQVGIHESFFTLGGHSLLATQVTSRVRDGFHLELPLRALFEAPTVADLAARIDAASHAGHELKLPPLERCPRDGDLPLSFAQQRLWFIHQLEPESPAYNIPLAMRLTGRLVAGALAASIAEIVRRHESLRTVFPVAASGPAQVIVAPESSALPLVDLSGLCAETREQEMRRLLDEDARQSFDLARGPLFRPRLLRLAAEEHVALATMHHIVADGWSLDVLVRELAALYQAFCAGSPPPLAELSLQYADFAVWQRQWLSGEVLDREIGHWQQRLAGAPPTLGLLGDRPRQGSSRGAEERLILPKELCAALRAVARREVVTPFMLLLAAFQALLSRHTGETDVCVGTPIAGRNRLETEGLIGFFVNTLVLRGELAGDPDVRSMLLRVRESALDAYAHQDLPFEKLVEELSPDRSLSHAPLFQVMFALQNAPRGEVRLPGLTLSLLAADHPTTKFDLSLSMFEQGGGYLGVLTYAADLFEPATIRRLLGHFEILLESFGRCAPPQAGPALRLSELALLSLAELHQVTVEWSNRLERHGPPAPEVRCLHELFERQVERAPEAVAVSFADTRWTYRELNRRSNRLARRLRRAGAGPGGRVAICAERSPEMVAMVLAVLKSGAAYVALDPEYPRARLEQILADCAPVWLLTQERLLGRLPGFAGEVLRVESEWDGAPRAKESEENPAPLTGAQDLAYIVYTSGSTGRPKGILAPHGGAAGYLSWLVRAYDLSGQDVALQLAPLSFDASVRDTLAPLAVGAQVVVVPSDIARDPAALVLRIAESGVTCLPSVVPSLLRRLAEEASRGQACTASLRLVLVSGETLFGSDCDNVREAFGAQVRIVNQYGPTECTMTSTHHAVISRAGEPAGVGIGRPNANACVCVLDRSLRPVPIGVPGEIFLGGAGLTHGYLGQPDRTAEAFVPDPLLQAGGSGGERVYRTGDLGRWLSDSSLQFLGRRDHQVKLRGVRVEPAEIESLLREHPAIRDVAVVAHEPAAGEASLCAYLVASVDLEPGALRGLLAHRLPASLIPSFFMTVDELPRTATGKLDRRRLPVPDPDAASRGNAPEVPRTITEEILASIWQEMLHVEHLGVRESFFDRGGHSLLATRMLSRVRQAFGTDLALRSVFESPTISGLALLIDEEKRKEYGLRIPTFESIATRVEAALSFSQQRLWFMDQMEPGNPFYNIAAAFMLDGRLDPAALEQAFAEVVRRQGSLRTVFASRNGQPVQRVQPPAPVILPIADLSTLGEEEQQAEARRLVVQEARAPFDLARGPLFRIRLLRLGESRHVVLVILHHIITDGWSTGVLIRELVELYESFSRRESSPLADLPLQYTDFAVWQQQWLRGEALETQLAYWRRQLTDAPAVTRLPTDRPRPAVQSYRGGRQSFELAAESCQRLRELSRREGGSLFMTVLAAYQAFLSSCAGEEVVVVGSPVSYRNWAEIEGLIGFFANTLLFRGDVSGNPSFRELLGRVRRTALEAFAHQHVPFDKLVSELRPERNLGYNPLFQAGFTFQTAAETSRGRSDLLVRPFGFELETTQFDLNLTVVDTGAKLVGNLQYSRDLFEEITVDLMRGQLQELMERVGRDPEIRMSDLRPLLAEVGRRRLGALKRELGPTSAPSLKSRKRQAVVAVTAK